MSNFDEIQGVRLGTSVDSCVLFIEPFYGGSHKQLIDTLVDVLNHKKDLNKLVHLITMPAKKWHWRARTSALYVSESVPEKHNFKTLFASSVLNLAELVALRPDLALTKKIVYFHENQLVYPVKEEKDRDFQYGYNQIITCLVSDIIVFNSIFNRDSFLNSISKFFKLQPDFRPKNIREKIEHKCRVLYFPINFPVLNPVSKEDTILHIVWPHRWEHDKDPETFFQSLLTLSAKEKKFKLSILGEMFSEVPAIFEEAKLRLSEHIQHVGYLDSKNEYYKLLQQADVVVSTAKHEFFGVSMLEATYCGCFPLCPNALVYPEIYPKQCLYNTTTQLVKRLSRFCDVPSSARLEARSLNIDFTQFSTEKLLPEYVQLFS